MMAKDKSGARIMHRNSGAGVAFERMMRRSSFKTAIVYVEGESDIAFYRWLVDRSKVTLEQMNGKNEAMEAVASANRRKEKGILAIVDSDFDHLLNIGPDDNVIRTDTHDIETMMLKEGVFQYAEYNYADEVKMASLKYSYEDAWSEIIRIGCCIGKLRLISKENALYLNFKDVEKELGHLISIKGNKVEFDDRQYVWECVHASSGCPKEFKEIYELYKADKREFDEWQICRGHDLSLLISIVFSKDIMGKTYIHRREIENVISSAYIASRKIKKTIMFSDIKAWQLNNLGWKILRDDLT